MSDNEEDIESPNTFYKPSFVLIAIDTDPSMFVKKESDGTTPFRDCINTCYNLANSLIFTQNKRSWSPFGIVLALEDVSASFVNFNENILDVIKFLKEKKDMSDDQLQQMYQRKGNVDLSAFFLLCKKKFKEIKSVFYSRTIVYITNDEDPVRGDRNQRFAAINEGKNFEANSITFEMVTMKETFDYKVFYNELFSVMKVPLVENIVEDEEGLLSKLSSLILVRYYQRKLLFFPFIGDQSRFLKLKYSKFIVDEKLYNNKYYSKSGKQLKKVPRTAEEGPKKYVMRYSQGMLEFDAEEFREIKHSDLPMGYTLLHVSDRVTDVGLVLTDITILEKHPKEDLAFFEQFWQYCVDKNKVLVCARKLRDQDKIRFVELIPKFLSNTRMFIVKTIPFNDEHKPPPSKLNVEVSDDLEYSDEKIDVTNELIENLTFDYDVKMFSNPANAKKKAYLRSKLLDEPQEDVEDVTLNKEGIDKSLDTLADTFIQLFKLYDEPDKKRRRKK